MSDTIKREEPGLELEEKIAAGVVLLLAGWFLWYFLGNQTTEDQTQQLAAVPALNEDIQSRVHLFGESETVATKSDSASVRDAGRTQQSLSGDAPNNTPQTSVQTPRRPLTTSAVEPAAAATALPKPPVSPRSEADLQQFTPAKQKTATPVPSQPAEVENPVRKPASLAPTTPQKAHFIAPAIAPITSDLSSGVLALSGTGQPGDHLQLLLNGRKASNITINDQGGWRYETHLAPGDYAIQLLSTNTSAPLDMQSALTRVVIPKPETPAVVAAPGLSAPPAGGILLEDQVVKQTQSAEPAQPAARTTSRAPRKPADPVAKVEVQKPQPAQARKGLYRVRPGDTLLKLSRRYKISLNRLLRANQRSIADKNQIEVGQMLVIPGHYIGDKP